MFQHPLILPSYADVLFVTTPSRNMLELNLRSEKLILFSPKAPQVKAMVDHFITELRKVWGGCPRAGDMSCVHTLRGPGWVPCKWDHAWGDGGYRGVGLWLWVLGGMWCTCVYMCVHACVCMHGLCQPPPCAQDSQYVVAVRNYSPEDKGQLSFHKGDIIHLQQMKHPERGEWSPHAKTPAMWGTGGQD